MGLFSARGYNIDSLTVAPTESEHLSRMTIVSHGDDALVEQITKHLNKLIEVLKVVDLTEAPYAERDLMLVKVRAAGRERDEMMRLTDIFRGHIIDVTERSFTIEITGDAGTRFSPRLIRSKFWKLSGQAFSESAAANTF